MVLALDADKLGLIAAVLVATIVMGLCFLQGVQGLEVAVRAGLTFIVTYGAVYFLVRVILRAALIEFAQMQRDRKRRKRAELDEQRAERREARRPTGPGEST